MNEPLQIRRGSECSQKEGNSEVVLPRAVLRLHVPRTIQLVRSRVLHRHQLGL